MSPTDLFSDDGERIRRLTDVDEGAAMVKPSEAKAGRPAVEGNIGKLLALVTKWQAEPGDHDERAAAMIDRRIAERRIELHNLDDWDWESWDEGEEVP